MIMKTTTKNEGNKNMQILEQVVIIPITFLTILEDGSILGTSINDFLILFLKKEWFLFDLAREMFSKKNCQEHKFCVTHLL